MIFLIKAHSSTAHRSTPMHHKTCKTIIKQKQQFQTTAPFLRHGFRPPRIAHSSWICFVEVSGLVAMNCLQFPVPLRRHLYSARAVVKHARISGYGTMDPPTSASPPPQAAATEAQPKSHEGRRMPEVERRATCIAREQSRNWARIAARNIRHTVLSFGGRQCKFRRA